MSSISFGAFITISRYLKYIRYLISLAARFCSSLRTLHHSENLMIYIVFSLERNTLIILIEVEIDLFS